MKEDRLKDFFSKLGGKEIVMGWPDASWVRLWNDVDSELKNDREGMRARKKICDSIKIVLGKDKMIAMSAVDSNNFERAHAYTNELLELAKMTRITCDVNWPQTSRIKGEGPARPTTPKPVKEPKTKKEKRVAPAAKAEVEKLITSKKVKSEREKFILAPTPTQATLPQVGLETRKEIDERTMSMLQSSRKLRRFTDSLPETKRIGSEDFTDEEKIKIWEYYQEIAKDLLPLLQLYNEIEGSGVQLPRGNLTISGRETYAFRDRIIDASSQLASLINVEGFPTTGITDLNDVEQRNAFISALSEEA